MAYENGSNLARVPPPPPPPPFKPSPPPPSPSPNGNSTVIVIVFVTLGTGLFFLAFVAAAICCFIKKRKKKSCQEVAEVIHVDGQRKVHEALVPGSHGQQAVMVTIEDDVHIDEVVKKKEQRLGHGLHGKHEGANSSSMEVVASSSSSSSDINVSHHQS